MHRTLEHFVRALRTNDVPVSVRESIEAQRTVALVGYADRSLLKDSLAVVLAKTPDEKAAFEHCFETFFARDDIASADEALGDAFDDVEPAGESALAEMLRQGDMTGIAAAMEAAGAAAGVAEMRYASQRGYFARRILDSMGLRELERQIAAQRRLGTEGGTATAEALERGRRYLLDTAREYVARQQRLFADANAEKLREEFLEIARLGSIDRRDFHRLQRLVRRMAKRLAARHSHRRKRARRGQLDVRRTMRRNVAYDGVPFETVWKRRKVTRPKVVVICDVSRSVAAVAEFLLLFLYSLNEVIQDLHAYAFSSHLVEVSESLESQGVEEAIVHILETVGFRPTDYGQALEDFAESHLDAVDRRTTVIVLGDARTNGTEPRVELLKALSERCKRLMWLNPEPEPFWGTGDSEMPRYRPFCHLARTCNTVRHLERVVDDLLASYMP